MTAELVASFEKQFPRGATIDVSLNLPANTFSVTALFGPSGCGKTTVLRCLAGLERPNSGRIAFGNTTWFDAKQRILLRPQERDIGFLFQDYALFPHLTVVQNIGFGLQNETLPERQHRINRMLHLLELADLGHRYPHQISGGQQQRVALARVLARQPKLLLLDEPLSALDATLREQLRRELRRILTGFGIPVVVVTHDRTEAIALADRVAVMQSGQIRQFDSVQEVFTRPKNFDLARIVGMETVVAGDVIDVKDGLATVSVSGVKLLAIAPSESVASVYVCIKGEDVTIQRGVLGESSVRNHLNAKIQSLVPEGPLVRVGLNCGFELTALVTRPACEELHLSIGDSITALLKAPAIHLVPRA